MKKLLLLSAFAIIGASTLLAQEYQAFGASFKAKKVVPVTEFQQTLEQQDSWEGSVKGEVKEVCKKEGCWLKLNDGSANGIMVKMKDHAFVLPKDIDGRTVIINGVAKRKTTSVDQLRHYAEDAGKSKEEIAAITEPKVEIVMEAAGVRLLEK